MSAIATLDNFKSSLRQRVTIQKTLQSIVNRQSLWAQSGDPAAGSLAIGNTANGLVPTSSTTGAPSIQAFTAPGYLTAASLNAFQVATSIQWRVWLYDRVFHCGSYGLTSGLTTLSAQPSFSTRLPTIGGSPDYRGLHLWYETNAASGAATLTITYTNQDGVAGRSTGGFAVSDAAGVSGSMTRINLQAGDSGIQKIESVTVSGGTSGSLNVIVARHIWNSFVRYPVNETVDPIERTCMPEIHSDACLALIVRQDSTGANVLTVSLEIAS